MKRSERLDALVQLGERLQREDDYLKAIMHRTQFNNAWFTIEHQEKAVRAIAEHFLQAGKLEAWLQPYDIPEQTAAKTVGLVMAGNIPLVGFHDWLCIFTAGHRAKVKLSEKDQYLFPYLLKLLTEIDERTASYTEIVGRLSGFDAVIATGSNNSARYFEAYFGRYPHIIRRNRNGVAVLTG
ncbi:MAG: acyl-CoA reductase, partial [Bacteroidetes bacterium]|nr:acyl-CoA reductase [Bacteroidota bacterium]